MDLYFPPPQPDDEELINLSFSVFFVIDLGATLAWEPDFPRISHESA